MQWYIAALRKYAVFSGRAHRTEFWVFCLVNVLVAVGISALGSILTIPENVLAVLIDVYWVAMLLPGLAVTVRRLHDGDRGGLWTLLILVPVVGAIVLLALLVQKGNGNSNRYGSAPSLTPSVPQVWSMSADTRNAASDSAISSQAADSVARVHQKSLLRQQAARAMELSGTSRQNAEQAASRVQTSSQALQKASDRLAVLESGRGMQLESLNGASLCEFWIDVPGYSGPVRGATARITRTGDIQHVSEVTGSTKSGLGGAVAGGLLLGPVGAIVGNNMARKTTVQTKVRQVDTRQSELEVVGPGFAWSVRQSGSESDKLSRFRDLVNARGACTEDVHALVEPESVRVEGLRRDLHALSLEYEAAVSCAGQANAAYEQLCGTYRAERCSPLDWMRAWASGARPTSTREDSAIPHGESLQNQAAPADWYPDPNGVHQHRYWDGSEWTSTVADEGRTAQDPI